MTTYKIESKAGETMGTFEGASAAEALAAMHRDAGYDVRAEDGALVFRSDEDERLCGGLDDWRVVAV